MEVQLVENKDIDFKTWDDFISQSPQGSIFTKSWYINALLPTWQALMITEKEEILAVMPLYIRRKLGFKYSMQPILSVYWGICLKALAHKTAEKKLNWEAKVIKKMVDAIPSDLLVYNYYFHPNFNYPLPFHWKNYELRTRYTYTLDLTKPFDALKKEFAKSRSRINTENKIVFSDNIDNHLHFFRLNHQKGKTILDEKYFDAFERIFQAAKENHSFSILEAMNAEGNIEGSALLFHDEHRSYLFSTVVHPDLHSRVTMAHIITEAIKYAQTKSDVFDFKGSMIEGIEVFFRSFGAIQQPYLSIYKRKITF